MLPRLLGYDADTREVTREVLGEWLKKNENKPFMRVLTMLLTARQYRESFERGRAEGRAEALAWVKRRGDALVKGEPFNEPPPWDTKPKTEN